MTQTAMILDYNYIRSSDAAIIMGVDPEKTLIDLFVENKTQAEITKKTDTNEWQNLRSEAIREASAKIGAAYSSKKIRHKDHAFIEAHLDGIDEAHGSIIMIRFLGKENHDDASNGKIAEKYKAIIQHNLMVAQQKVAYFISINGSQVDKDKIASVRIEADIQYQQELLKKEIEWFETLESDTCPIDKKYLKLAEAYRQAKIKQEEAKNEVDAARKSILDSIGVESGAKSIDLGLVKITTTSKKGNVDYDALLKAHGLDKSEKERYRESPTEITSVTLTSPSRLSVLTEYL